MIREWENDEDDDGDDKLLGGIKEAIRSKCKLIKASQHWLMRFKCKFDSIHKNLTEANLQLLIIIIMTI